MLDCGCIFFFSSRRRHTRYWRDWSSECALPIYRAYGDPTLRNFLLLGVAIGVATLTRAEGLLHGGLLLAGCGLRARTLPTRDRVGRTLAAGGVVLEIGRGSWRGRGEILGVGGFF